MGEIATFSKGTGYSKKDLESDGTPIILYGRMYTNYELVIQSVDTFTIAKEKSIYSNGGEVIVPASGEAAEDISVASVVEQANVLLGGDLNIIYTNENVEPVFLALSITNGEPHKDMAKRAQGKSVVHLHNSDLAQIKLSYPSKDEQKKIDSYFLKFDTLIALYQRKPETLKLT
ncbi:restriction endonuclease subunit S [Ligilactobacillus agilis]|nr:restriction endonuclease subunit S [Ligilactobacillus agilis]